MPNYDYANSAGLTALSERTFEKIKKEITTDIVTSEAANPLILETESAQTAKSTIIGIEPIQDLHGYDKPWPAGGNKNKFSSDITLDYTINADGTVSSYNDRAATFDFISIAPSTEYTLSYVTQNNTQNGVFFYSSDSESGFISFLSWGVSARTFTSPSNANYVRFSFSTNVLPTSVQLELGSTATSFAPYSNICPITGVDEIEVRATGKNLFDEKYEGISSSLIYMPIFVGNNIVTLSTTTPTQSGGGRNLFLLTGNVTTGASSSWNGVSVNAPRFEQATNGFVTVAFRNESNVDPRNYQTQLELGSTATDYEPYQGYTASVDLPEEVYSGTLDLETGEVVATWVNRKLKDLNWEIGSSYFYVYNVGDKKGGVTNVIASCYRTLDVPAANLPNGAIKSNEIGSAVNLYAMDLAYTTASELKEARGNEDICYELATPITYQLTPQQLALFKGINNISTNAKTVQVTYRNGELATLEELNAISFDLSNVKSKLPPIIIKDGMLQVTYDDGQ